MISGSVQSIAERTFTAMGRPELIEDPWFATNEARVADAEEVDHVVGEWVGQRSRDEAMEVLLRHEGAAIPVMNIEDLMSDPHMIAREAITTGRPPSWPCLAKPCRLGAIILQAW